MGKIFIGSVSTLKSRLYKAATTKAGLAKEIGVSTDTIRRNLPDGFVAHEGSVWHIAEVELVKVGGKRGKLVGGKKRSELNLGGFMGMKGKNGLLESPE